jgi:C1A family cysteine protease|eukprot:gene11287-8020_t
MIYQTVVALAVLAAANAKLFPEDPVQQKYMWESFKREFRQEFSTMEEESHRFGHFLENLRMADNRNEAERKSGGSAVHGITKFSHLSQAEFESQLLTSDIRMRSTDRKVDSSVRTPDATMGLVDWSGVYTTPVKNQGYCGSCWAFSATEQIESDSMRTLGTSYILSPEQITQCATKAYGCNGGWTEVAYAYVKSAGGIVQESDYPYTSYYGKTGTCAVDLSQSVITVSGFTSLSGESNMAAYVQSTGPLSVCLDASSWNSYTGGIMTTCGQDVDHCVQAVGVDASTGGYWKVRNSWGSSWGENGYIRLAYGQNTCNISNDPTYTTVGKK